MSKSRKLFLVTQFSYFFLQSLQFVLESGKTLHVSVLPFVIFKRLDRRAPPDAGADDLSGEDAGLRTDDRTALDADVIAETHLPADDTVVLDRNAARNARLGRDHTAFADVYVVADLDQIVDLRTLADPRLAESPTVDAGISPDLYVVFEDDRTDLRKFDVAFIAVADISEAVRSDHNARMQDHTVADHRIIFNEYVRMQDTFTADIDVIAYLRSGPQLRSVADP